MTFTEAAAEVLRLVGKPLHYKDITEIAIQRNLLSHVGKSPEVTMGSRLAALLKKGPKENPLVRVKPGVFALRSWEEGGPPGPAPEGSVALPPTLATDAEDETESPAALEGEEPSQPRSAEQLPMKLEPKAPAAPPRPRAEDRAEPAADERMRADLAAGAGEIFGEEEDDDQPILSGDTAADAGAGRRRRRRRRGRGGEGPSRPETADGLPSYTVSPAFGDGAAPAPAARDGGEAPSEGAQEARSEGREPREPRREGRDRRDRDQRDREPRDREPREPREARGNAQEGPAIDAEDLAGRDMVDVVIGLLGSFDRNGGPVSFRALAEAATRRGRIAGDLPQIQSQIASAVRADNLRRQAESRRPRFRLAGGRVALVEWSMGPDLVRLENEAMAAIERYREGARRALVRRITELPPHGFAELVVTLLERLGLSQIKAVRRPGAAGGEAHFSALSRGPGGDTRVAVVVRKDGREIGRERVIEIRGSLHHYGPAWGAWLVTAGHALSGAREEATAPGGLPVNILDGTGVGRLCEEHGLGVVRTSVPLCVPDAEVFEGLRGG